MSRCPPSPPRRRPPRRLACWPSGSACRSSPTRPHGIWALGPETAVTGRVLTSAVAPDLELPDADGNPSSCRACAARRSCWSRGRRGAAAASTCPLWQQLRDRWKPLGVEVVTVALDVEASDARPFIEQGASREHPSLIDEAHVSDELFGFVNVPNGVWIDEDGMIVRPAEPAHPGRNPAHRVVPQDRRVDGARPTSRRCSSRRARSRATRTSTSR